MTSDGVPHVFAINTLAPYHPDHADRTAEAARLSELRHARARERESRRYFLAKRPWDGSSAYAESKLHDVMLAFTVARLWKNVLSNAVTPGWVATKMGGAGRPTTLPKRISRKRGSRPATMPRRRPLAAISITSSAGSRTARRARNWCRTGLSTSARRFPGSICPGADLGQRIRAVPLWCVLP